MDERIIYRKPLIENLPQFMRHYKEIKEVLSAEDKEIDELNMNLEKVLNNAFILDCDEYGIRKYENILKITANSTETLKSRKARVLLKWNDMVPYTYRVLMRRLDSLCGVNNYTVVNDLKNNYIKFIVHLSLFSEIKTVEEVLDDMLPMNVQYEIENIIQCSVATNAYVAGTTEHIEIIEIGG